VIEKLKERNRLAE